MRYLCFKYVNISVVLILLSIGGGCEKSDNYKITGMLYGFADNTKVSLTLAATHQDEKKEMESKNRQEYGVLTGLCWKIVILLFLR